MYKDPEVFQPDTTKRRFMVEELHGLIDALQNLHSHISSILASARIHPSRLPSGPRDSLNIADPLKKYIARTTAEPQAAGRKPPRLNGESLRPHRETLLDSAENTESRGPRHHQENDLSEYLSRKATDQEQHSDMSEKMRVKTIDHIKKAMRLAKQGDVEGAKINAELADSAMKTAIEYMPDDEYAIFREEVLRRLDALQGMGEVSEA